MKKLLIATAAMAVVAGAQAQSSVTVYGGLDVNVNSTETGTAGANTLQTNNSIYTSRLGFKGTEDLGGGLKAEFQLEAGLLPSTGAFSSTSNTFKREAWVGLSSATLGTVRMGSSDITDAVNIDAAVSQMGNLGLQATEMGTDVSNVIRYTTPTFNGFSAQLGYANPTQAYDATAETTTGRITSAMVKYEAGSLGLYAGSLEKKESATRDQKQAVYGAKYTVAGVTLGAVYSVLDPVAASVANGKTKQTNVSASTPVALLGSGITAHAVYTKSKNDLASSGDTDGYKLALTKAFSKRTTGYVGYADISDNNTAANDVKQYLLGVIHTF